MITRIQRIQPQVSLVPDSAPSASYAARTYFKHLFKNIKNQPRSRLLVCLKRRLTTGRKVSWPSLSKARKPVDQFKALFNFLSCSFEHIFNSTNTLLLFCFIWTSYPWRINQNEVVHHRQKLYHRLRSIHPAMHSNSNWTFGTHLGETSCPIQCRSIDSISDINHPIQFRRTKHSPAHNGTTDIRTYSIKSAHCIFIFKHDIYCSGWRYIQLHCGEIRNICSCYWDGQSSSDSEWPSNWRPGPYT